MGAINRRTGRPFSTGAPGTPGSVTGPAVSIPSRGTRPSSSPTGGTRILVDVTTGKSAIVQESPELLRRIEASRLKAVRMRQTRRIERETTARTVRDLRKTGVKNIKLTSAGIEGEKAGRRLIITRQKRIIDVPKGATVNVKNIERMIERKRKSAVKTALVRVQLKQAPGKKDIELKSTRVKKKDRVAGLRGRIEKLETAAQARAKRGQRVEDLITLIPGLRSTPTREGIKKRLRSSDFSLFTKVKGFAQRLVVVALAFPTNATIGFADTLIGVGGKLAAFAEAATLKETRANIGDAAFIALKKTPAAVGKAFDPRTPDGLINIGAAVLAVKMAASARGNVIAKKGTIKTTSTKKSFNSSNKSLVVKQKGSFQNIKGKKVNFETRRVINPKGQGRASTIFKTQKGRIIGKTSARTKLVKGKPRQVSIARRAGIKQVGKKAKTTKAQHSTKRALARENVRKLDATTKSIKIREANLKFLKKSKVAKLFIKREIAKLNSLKKGSRILQKQLRKDGFPPGARGGLRKELAGKPGKPIKVAKLIKPKGKTILKIRLKKGPRKVVEAITLPLKKTTQTVRSFALKVKRFIKRVDARGKKIDVKIQKRVDAIVNRIVRESIKLDKLGKAQLNKIARQFNRIKNPTVKQVKTFLSKANKIIRKVGKKTSDAAARTERALLRKLDKTTNKLAIKFSKLEKGVSRLTDRQINRILNLDKALKASIRRGGGRLTKPVKSILRRLEKAIPFKVKLIKIKPRRAPGVPKPRTGRRAQPRRAARKTRITDREKAILDRISKGKEKITTSTPTRVRKLLRRKVIKGQAEINKLIGDIKRKNSKEATIFLASKKSAQKGARSRLRLLEQADKRAAAKVNKLQQAQGKAISKAKKQTQGTGQQTLLKQLTKETKKTKALNKQANAMTKAKPTKRARSAASSAKKTLSKARQQLVLISKKVTAKPLKGIFKRQAAIIGALIPRFNIARARFNAKGGIITPIPDIKDPITKTDVKDKVKSKEKIKEDTIIIPDETIDTANVDIVRIVTSILGAVAGTQFLRSGGKVVAAKTPLTKSNIRALRPFLFRQFRKKRFVFLPDMYSLIFGVRATPKQRITLLKPGRIFTGVERRAIVT